MGGDRIDPCDLVKGQMGWKDPALEPLIPATDSKPFTQFTCLPVPLGFNGTSWQSPLRTGAPGLDQGPRIKGSFYRGDSKATIWSQDMAWKNGVAAEARKHLQYAAIKAPAYDRRVACGMCPTWPGRYSGTALYDRDVPARGPSPDKTELMSRGRMECDMLKVLQRTVGPTLSSQDMKQAVRQMRRRTNNYPRAMQR